MRLPTSYLRHALLATTFAVLPACGGAGGNYLEEPPLADSGTGAVDTGTFAPDSGNDTGTDTGGGVDSAPPPSCAFTVTAGPGPAPCSWTTVFQVDPAECIGSGGSTQAQCAALCGANANGATPDRCYVGTGDSVDCFVDQACGGPGGGGFGP